MKVRIADVDNIQDKSFKLHRPLGKDDYLFVLFKSPSKVMVNGEYTDADIGSGILFGKHMFQSYYSRGGDFIHDFIHFDTENDYELMTVSEIHMGQLITIPSPDGISGILSQIKSELYITPTKYRNEIITNLCMAFLYRLKSASEVGDIAARGYFAELYELRRSIYDEPWKSYSIDTMAGRLKLSRSYFQYLYKSLFSVSCMDDVINARIAHAKILLSGTSLTVSEIAEKCGYKNDEHFSRQFKKTVGISPIGYRNG